MRECQSRGTSTVEPTKNLRKGQNKNHARTDRERERLLTLLLPQNEAPSPLRGAANEGLSLFKILRDEERFKINVFKLMYLKLKRINFSL